MRLVVITILLFPFSLMAFSQIDVFEKYVEDLNMRNALKAYYSSAKQYLETPVEGKAKLYPKLVDSYTCLNFFEKEKSIRYDMNDESEMNIFMDSISKDLSKYDQYYTLKNDLDSKLQKINVENKLSICSFKIDPQALKKFQEKTEKENKLVEENFNALMDYKKRAHPSLKNLISYLDGTDMPAAIVALKTLVESRMNSAEKAELNASIKEKQILTIVKKRNVFKQFVSYIKNQDNSLQLQIKSKMSEPCRVQSKQVYNSKCANKALYNEIPGLSNKIYYCLKDHEDALKPECQTLKASNIF